MQRQKSILSFFDISSLQGRRLFPPKQSNVDPILISEDPPFPEVAGTETPPEKVPRPRFPSTFHSADANSPRFTSAILRKLVKDSVSGSEPEKNLEKSASENYSSRLHFPPGLPEQGAQFQSLLGRSTTVSKDNCNQVSLHTDSMPEDLGPETPATRPLVPRFKRIQEDSIDLDPCKRTKLSQHLGTRNKANYEVPEIGGNKFEWLEPSLIRDANRRRPGDALYDQRTLYIPPSALKEMSASQKQYWSIKCQYMDVLLFFKVGKFYELYELDAEIGHKELDWKITNSGVGKCKQVGISECGIDEAIQKLIARGYKVGRIEQIETSGQAKARGASSVIQRKLVNVYTPSTSVIGNLGPNAVHLLALKEEENHNFERSSATYGFAFLDYATLKFWIGHVNEDGSGAALGALLMQVSPKEVIYESQGLSAEAHKALKKYSSAGSLAMQLSPTPPGIVFIDASEVKKLIEVNGYFRCSRSWASALDDVVHSDLAFCALGGLINHLSRLMLEDALYKGDIRPYDIYKSCLRMDGQTLLNLEIFGNNVDGSSSGTLYKHLDRCVTPSGKRLLRNWICHPLKSIADINERLDVVESLIKCSEMTVVIEQYLRRLPDLERLLGRVKASVGSSEALLLPIVGEKTLKQRVKAFGSLVKGLQIGLDLLRILMNEEHQLMLLSKILKLPLLSGGDGLDELLAQFEAAVDNNFPFYQDHDVKESDGETLSVLLKQFSEKHFQWSQVIDALNCIDVLRSFAVTASSSRGSMCRPVIVRSRSSSTFSFHETGGPVLMVRGLWHPYAVGVNGGELVPNDVYLGKDNAGCCPHILLLTGPNMGGKSTLLRAMCLAVLLAQLGCYVPSEMCVLSPVDTIFTRLGATDRIMSGESTFLVECMETASILQHATQDSLVILDELGRGTSTFDGYAIAYAVLRHLVEKVHCRLLFATHYHPLTKEFASHAHVKLQHMACAFKAKSGSSNIEDQELIFLYRLALGACPESYGLQVALMAGIPKQVVKGASFASQKMKNLVLENFRSGEQRSEFSTCHEGWLKTLLAVASISECDLDEDASDTLLLLWHEVKSFYNSNK